MKRQRQELFKCLWNAARFDASLSLLLILPHSLAEISMGVGLGVVLQLILSDAPRVFVSELVPHGLRAFLNFGQVVDRKDLSFAVPLVLTAIGAVKLLTGFGTSYLMEKASQKSGSALRAATLQRCLLRSGQMTEETSQDALAAQIVQDCNLLQNAVGKAAIGLIKDLATLVFILVTLIFIDFKMFGYLCLGSIPFVIMAKKSAQKIDGYAKAAATSQNALCERLLETREGILTIAALRSQAREQRDLDDLGKKHYQLMAKSFLIRTLPRPFTEFLAIFLLCSLLVLRYRSDTTGSPTGRLDFSALSTTLILLALAIKPIKSLGQNLTQWVENRSVFARMENLWERLDLHSPVHAKSHEHLKNINLHPRNEGLYHAIITENVTFKNAAGTSICDNCSVKIRKGTRVAFIGESGAGKSTFLRLLAGILPPSSGRIWIMQDHILATQVPYVFKGTVEANVSYLKNESVHYSTHGLSSSAPPDEELLGLLQDLGLCHSPAGALMLAKRPLGHLGEGLSGGEKARVALGRALFAHPQLLLLDEPTANLDEQSSGLFWTAVETWRKKDSNHTVVAVSHMLNEIKDWDYCYVFDNGRITNAGLPRDLHL